MATSVLVLVDGFDEREFDGAIIADSVDGAVGDAETNGAMSCPLASERLVVEARAAASGFQTHGLDGADPSHELSDDVCGALLQVLSGTGRQNHGGNHLSSVAESVSVSTVQVDGDGVPFRCLRGDAPGDIEPRVICPLLARLGCRTGEHPQLEASSVETE